MRYIRFPAFCQAGLMRLDDNPRRYMIERTDGEVEEGNGKREKKAK